MAASVAFYTGVLDFELVENGGEVDPTASVLLREGAPLFLSSHRGDGEYRGTVAGAKSGHDIASELRERARRTERAGRRGERVRLSGSSRGEAPRLILVYRYGDSNPGPVAENHVS